jgi:hypothetical protein
MTKIIAIFLALSLTVAATSSYGQVVIGPPPPPMAGGSHFGSGHGGVVVGSIFATAASLIACAMIIGNQAHRELNSKEVFWGSLIPLGCLLVPH